MKLNNWLTAKITVLNYQTNNWWNYSNMSIEQYQIEALLFRSTDWQFIKTDWTAHSSLEMRTPARQWNIRIKQVRDQSSLAYYNYFCVMNVTTFKWYNAWLNKIFEISKEHDNYCSMVFTDRSQNSSSNDERLYFLELFIKYKIMQGDNLASIWH